MASTPAKGAAVGFMDLVEPKSPQGSAVGFLDMIDDDEAAALVQEKEEEEKWIRESLASLSKSAVLLENLVTCMQSVKDAWPYYMQALSALFADADSSSTLVRFLIDSEVRNTTKLATLFREDSVRIQGVQMTLLNSMREWGRAAFYKSILSKVVSSPNRVKNVDAVALEILRAFCEHISTLPSNVQQILNQIGQAVESKFPQVKKDGYKSASIFLFLHVVTPMIVSPSSAGLCKDVIKDRDALLALAKIGRVIQKWVNVALGSGDDEDYLPRSISEMSLSSIADDGSSGTTSGSNSRSDTAEHPTTRAAKSAGELEVLKFVELLFKTDGPPPVVKKPDQEEVSDARNVIAAALKKNYKLLRELEVSLDRQQALNKHLGLQRGKLFAAFTRQATVDNLKLSCKFSVIPEALNEEAVKGENAIVNEFSEFSRTNAGTFQMGRDRYVFFPAAALSSFYTSKFVGEATSLFQMLNYNQFYTVGAEDFRAQAKDGLFKGQQNTGMLALFPFLACSGWGRAALSVNSVIGRTKEEFFLNVRIDNAAEMMGVDVKKSSDPRCFMLAGLMAGWCSEAMGFKVHCVEVKQGLFVLASALTLDVVSKRVASELKISAVPKLVPLFFFDGNLGGAAASAASSSSTPDSASKKSRTVSLLRKGLDEAAWGACSVVDALDVLRAGFLNEVKSGSEKRDRGASFADRLRSASMKKPQPSVGDLKKNMNGSIVRSMSKDKNLSLAEGRAPTSVPEAGEFRYGETRMIAVRASAIGVSFLMGMQSMLGLTKKKTSKKGSDLRGQVKSVLDDTFTACKVGSSLLYGYGLSIGSEFASLSLDPSPDAKNKAGLRTWSEALADLQVILDSCGWGQLSFSSLSQTERSEDDDVWLLCHVVGSMEAANRLGSVWDTGSPTCLLMAGTIASYVSKTFGIRAACVEMECHGAGTSRENHRCSFMVSVPNHIVSRCKIYLAASSKESLYNDLVTGLRPNVFEDKDDEAKKQEATKQAM